MTGGFVWFLWESNSGLHTRWNLPHCWAASPAWMNMFHKGAWRIWGLLRLGATKVASVTQLYTLIKLNGRALLKKMNVPSIPALKMQNSVSLRPVWGRRGEKCCSLYMKHHKSTLKVYFMLIFIVCVCVCECVLRVHGCLWRLAKWMDLLGLELQAIVSCQTWVLGIKFWPYGCAGSIFTH